MYIYLREDGTPYYVGKGMNARAWHKGRFEVKPPIDKARIIIVAHKLFEREALILEVRLIAMYGRKDNGTGILRNQTDGGDGKAGVVHSEITLQKRRDTRKKNAKPNPVKGIHQNKITCPKCGKAGGSSSMKRYHFDNCGKTKPPPKIDTCDICGVTTTIGNLARYHNGNCGKPSVTKGSKYKITQAVKTSVCPYCGNEYSLSNIDRHKIVCKMGK